MTHQNIGGSLFVLVRQIGLFAGRQINVVVGADAEAIYDRWIGNIHPDFPGGCGLHEPLILWN